MPERTVLSSFYTQEEAKKAAERIEGIGVETTKVDELHAFGGIHAEQHAFPITGDIPSLASITLDTSIRSRDAGIMLAADPSASGMADREGNDIGRNWLLTVVCEDALVEEVVQIIKDGNGYT